jgi:4-amino-4-deoxy-L-arabinose transferase-like glycosyltransferase
VTPIVPALPATLAGVAILLLPGVVFLALLPARERRSLALDEAVFLAVGGSVAASAWLALVLAELGRFSLPGAGALLAVASGAAAWIGRRRLGWPLAGPTPWRRIVPTVLVLALAVGLQARPSQYLVGGRDPGAYVATMALIARSGSIVYTDPAVLSIPAEDLPLFFRHPESPDFSWSRLMGFDLERPQSGRVVPQFFHLFPAFGAYLFQSMGAKGALASAPLFGILGTLGAYLALRRLFGAATALVAALLLCLNVVQVWFARFPVSETVSQFLIFLALVAFWHWEERGHPAFGALAGSALGLTLLVRIDSVLLGLPLALYLLARRTRGELAVRAALPLLLPLALLSLHAALHASLWSRKYVESIANRNYWSAGAWTAAALALAGLAVAVEGLRPRLARVIAARGNAWRRATALAVAVLALYAYFVRPELSAWAGAAGNDASRSFTNFSALDRDGDGRLAGGEFARRPVAAAPLSFAALDEDADGLLNRVEWPGDAPFPLAWLGFSRLAAHDAQSFRRLGWFLSPLGLLLGTLGLMLVLREGRPRHLFPVLLALSFGLFYFYKMRVWNDYFFALRRFVPVVVPFLLAFAAYALVRLGARRGWRRVLAALLATVLAALYARDTSAIARYVDWKNAVPFVADVSRRFTPNDVVIFEQPRSIHLLSLPLWAVHGVNVLELARFDPDPESLRHLLRAWHGRYRNIYFVHTYRTDLCGVFLQRVEDVAFGTHEWERTYDRPPRRPEPRGFGFRISRVVPPEELRVPALAEVDVGGSDDFQVSGFFDKEGGGAHSYRWTGACASVYLPGAHAGDKLTLTAAVGERPASLPAVVSATLSGVPLGSFTVEADWKDFGLHLPDPLPPGAPVLRLDVPVFRPVNVLPGSSDPRDLGIMLDRIRLAAPGAPRAP